MVPTPVREAAQYYGPVYLRFTRDPVPIIYNEKDEFIIGKGKLLAQGKDVSLFALGDMLDIALQARKLLLERGIEAEVVDFHTIKPIDRAMIVESAQKTRRVVTLEDHQFHGGLGSAVAEILGEDLPTPIRRIGLRDTFAESGEYNLLIEKYFLDVNAVIAAVSELMEV